MMKQQRAPITAVSVQLLLPILVISLVLTTILSLKLNRDLFRKLHGIVDIFYFRLTLLLRKILRAFKQFRDIQFPT